MISCLGCFNTVLFSLVIWWICCLIGANTCAAWICVWAKKSTGLPVLWSNFMFWSCILCNSLRFGVQYWFLRAVMDRLNFYLVACREVLKNCNAWSCKWSWRNCGWFAAAMFPTLIKILSKFSKSGQFSSGFPRNGLSVMCGWGVCSCLFDLGVVLTSFLAPCETPSFFYQFWVLFCSSFLQSGAWARLYRKEFFVDPLQSTIQKKPEIFLFKYRPHFLNYFALLFPVIRNLFNIVFFKKNCSCVYLEVRP